MTKRLADINGEPEIGKFYLVPSVIDRYGEIVPVLGPEHTDKEWIGFNQSHFHFDLRFLSAVKVRELFAGFSGRTVCTPEELAMTRVHRTKNDRSSVEERRVKCRRRMPVFPIRVALFSAQWLQPMEEFFKSVTLDCRTCPHRGLPLSDELADEDGVVICPGHGLAWNLRTGKIVSRLERL